MAQEIQLYLAVGEIELAIHKNHFLALCGRASEQATVLFAHREEDMIYVSAPRMVE